VSHGTCHTNHPATVSTTAGDRTNHHAHSHTSSIVRAPDDHRRHHVLEILQVQFQSEQKPDDVVMLAEAIAPYLRRTRLPHPEAVRRIAGHYLQDGARVQKLLHARDATEWQSVLRQVVAIGTTHPYAPNDVEVASWPDLAAYEDIQRHLATYNFEGPFDGWIRAVVVSRLRSHWRSRQTRRLGGRGVMPRAMRDAATEEPRRTTWSLDASIADGLQVADTIAADDLPVHDLVEAGELRRIVLQGIQDLADHKGDRLLSRIWVAVVEEQRTLEEAAGRLGISISQLYRRLRHMRSHLRRHRPLLAWLELSDDAQA
jgi:DNA-directed RNA polymerase specialized sigma24 family protein